MQLTRVQVETPYVLTRVFTVDDQPANATGNVTVTVRRLDGTVLDTVTAGGPGPVGTYTYTSTGRAVLDTLTVEWSGVWSGANVKVRDVVEIVGGFMFEVADARNRLGGLAKNSTASIVDRRNVVEFEADRIRGGAFVPRFKRVQLTAPYGGDPCRLALPSTDVRAIRSITENGTAWSVDQLAGVDLLEDAGVIYAAGGFWPGVNRYVIEYEHGLDGFDPAARECAIQRLKYWLGAAGSQIPSNAISFTVQDGGVYRLSQPGTKSTGDLAVDAVYRAGAYGGPV